MPESTAPTNTQSQSSGQSPAGDLLAGLEITPELVAQIAERVFHMLLMDLKIERERFRVVYPGPHRFQGEG